MVQGEAKSTWFPLILGGNWMQFYLQVSRQKSIEMEREQNIKIFTTQQ